MRYSKNVVSESYLTDRKQTVEIENHISTEEKGLSDVLQDSVLGPLMFLYL